VLGIIQARADELSERAPEETKTVP